MDAGGRPGASAVRPVAVCPECGQDVPVQPGAGIDSTHLRPDGRPITAADVQDARGAPERGDDDLITTLCDELGVERSELVDTVNQHRLVNMAFDQCVREEVERRAGSLPAPPPNDVTAHVEWGTVGTDEDGDEGIETFESKDEAVEAAGRWRARGMTNVYVERHDVSTTRTVVEGEPQAADDPVGQFVQSVHDAHDAWCRGEPQADEPPFARGSAQEAREHMRFQNAIEQRLREHGAGYEDEPWFPDVIYGAAAAALAAAGAERAEEEQA